MSAREQLRSLVRDLVARDGRSPETIGQLAWPDIDRRAAGARVRYVLSAGWTKPEILDDIARALGVTITITANR